MDIEIRSHLDLRSLERKENPLVVPCMAGGSNDDLLLNHRIAKDDPSVHPSLPSGSEIEPRTFKSHLGYVSSDTRSIRVRTCGHGHSAECVDRVSEQRQVFVCEACSGSSESRLHTRTPTYRNSMGCGSTGVAATSPGGNPTFLEGVRDCLMPPGSPF